MAFNYTYNISTDFPGGVCNESNLTTEIKVSSISTALTSMGRAGDVLTITFASQLSAGDKITLDNNQTAPAGGLIAAHISTAPTEATSSAFDLVLSPASIGADQNNYNPLNIAYTGLLRLTSSTSVNITGISTVISGVTTVVAAPGRVMNIHNTGANNITLVNESSSSNAVNRFSLRGSADYTLTPNKAASIQYDGGTSRWRLLGVDDPYGTTANTVCQGNDSRLSVGNTMVQVTVDFGNPTGPSEGDTAVITVVDATVSGTTKFICNAAGGTSDHDVEDVACEGIQAYVSNIVASTSYDVIAYAPQGTWGRYFVNVMKG